MADTLDINDARRIADRIAADIKRFAAQLDDDLTTFPSEEGALADRLFTKAERFKDVKEKSRFDELRAVGEQAGDAELSRQIDRTVEALDTATQALTDAGTALSIRDLTEDQVEEVASAATAALVPAMMRSGRVAVQVRNLDPSFGQSQSQSQGL